MKYEEIMNDITKGLTGEPKKDMKYLMEQCEVYKTHELANEILRGIGRLIADMTPKEAIDEIERLINKEIDKMTKIIDQAELQIQKKNFKKALEILDPAIKEIEAEDGGLRMFRDDSVNEYHYFRNPLEEMLYKKTMKPERTMRKMPIDLGRPYYLCGFLYFELKQYDKARDSLNKAVKINPVNVTSIFELAEIDKMNRDWDHYLTLSKQCLSLSYTGPDIARAYRNLGFYYIEKQEYDVATALYHMSMFYQESTMAQSELFIIQQLAGKVSSGPKTDDIEEIFKKNGIQYGPNDLIVNIAFGIAKTAEQEGYTGLARYYYSVLYELTFSDEVKEWLDALPDEE